MMALRRKLEVAANNVANIETSGFRAQQLSFQEYLKPEKGQEIGAKPERPLSLVDAATAYTTTNVGSLRATGNPLDLAIGNGYFMIETPYGERLTRDGSFTCERAAWDRRWIAVMADGGVISVPPKAGDISIDTHGVVSTKLGVLGRLRVVTFDE